MTPKSRQAIVSTDTGDVERFTDEKTGNPAYITWLRAGTRGRPTEKDWLAAMRWLVVKVNKDGLPTGRGANTILADWIHKALAANNMEASQSMVAEHARLILAEADKIQ